MAAQFYKFLSDTGYHHPVHPALTHLPVGLTISAFIFMALGYILKRSAFLQTAKHCVVLALLTAIPTMMLGYLDWQHFYHGALIFPIKMKLILAFVLLGLLLVTAAAHTPVEKERTALQLLMHALSLLVVVAIGYFGGELVYGKRQGFFPAAGSISNLPESARAGEKIFEEKCSFCHFTDRTATKVGPGLKGLFHRKKMPASGRPVSVDSLRRQLETPYRHMPAFKDFDAEQINALADYLKTL